MRIDDGPVQLETRFVQIGREYVYTPNFPAHQYEKRLNLDFEFVADSTPGIHYVAMTILEESLIGQVFYCNYTIHRPDLPESLRRRMNPSKNIPLFNTWIMQSQVPTGETIGQA